MNRAWQVAPAFGTGAGFRAVEQVWFGLGRDSQRRSRRVVFSYGD
jgi:hypothetical protein